MIPITQSFLPCPDPINPLMTRLRPSKPKIKTRLTYTRRRAYIKEEKQLLF